MKNKQVKGKEAFFEWLFFRRLYSLQYLFALLLRFNEDVSEACLPSFFRLTLSK